MTTDTGRRTAGVSGTVRRAAAFEAAMWRSLHHWVRRRPPVVAPGGEAFGYVNVVKPILGVFIGLSAIEIPILDLILSRTVPWQPVRLIAVAIGIYGLFWMIGLLASMRVHPHVLDESGLRVRSGASVDVLLPWDAVAAVRARYRSLPSSRTVQVLDEEDGTVAHIVTASQTSVDVVLREPRSLPLPKGPSAPVGEVRFYADDPDALVARARHLLAAPR